MSVTQDFPGRRSKGKAYAFWLLIIFGVGGGQRFYAGRHISGLIYMFTGGFFGFGQLLDLILIPQMIDDFNSRQRLLNGNLAANQVIVNVHNGSIPERPQVTDSNQSLVPQLLKAAQQTKGRITVTEGVIATGKTFKEVEEALLSIHRDGYATIDNDPSSGIVIYRIDQLIG